MSPFAADFLETNHRLLAILAIIVSLATWGVDLAGWVYQCPYCRVQRSAIGVIGVILLLPCYHHWILRMIGSAVGALGLVVAANQNFSHIARMHRGKFEWGDQWFIHPWLLSGFALFILTALLMMLWSRPQGTATVTQADI
jgi:hypothetical protein